SSGTITQNQNTGSGAKSVAVVRQNSSDQRNDAALRHFNRQIATVHSAKDKDDDDGDTDTGSVASFSGTIDQQQGNFQTCPNGGLCGFEFQNSTGVQRAFERQNEVQRLFAPPGANQTQVGPEFCC